MAEKDVIKEKWYSSDEQQQIDIKSKWWTQKDESIYAHVTSVVDNIQREQEYRSTKNVTHARLFANREILDLLPGNYGRPNRRTTQNSQKMTYNIVKSSVDTLSSKIGKVKTRPYFLTEGGDWGKQDRAKKLTQYMDGLFDDLKIYRHGRLVFRDGCVLGLGALKMWTQDGEIKAERVISEEIIVDEMEGAYGSPRQLHQVKNMHREVALDLYGTTPAKRQAIEEARKVDKDGSQQKSSADMIRVTESWHLRSGPKARDGKHTITVSSGTLFAEEYKRDRFPFVFWRWSQDLMGFYGMGLSEELAPIQLEINKLLRTIQKAMHLAAVPQVWLDYESKEVSEKITNKIASQNYYAGKPPIWITPGAMPPEVYAHLNDLFDKGFFIAGISQLSAAGLKPRGLDSGVALRNMQDIESDRFALTQETLEEFYMDVADLAIELTEELYEAAKDEKGEIDPSKAPKIRVKKKKSIEEISWADVRMDCDDYVLRKYPSNLLPTQPEAKLQTVQELVQAGYIPREDAMSLLDFPDVENYRSLETAYRDHVNFQIDQMLSHNKPQKPLPFGEPNTARRYVMNAYYKADREGAPDERLALLRDYMDLLDAAQAKIDEAAMAQQVAAEQPQVDPAAQGVPEPAPQSELMPVAG